MDHATTVRMLHGLGNGCHGRHAVLDRACRRRGPRRERARIAHEFHGDPEPSASTDLAHVGSVEPCDAWVLELSQQPRLGRSQWSIIGAPDRRHDLERHVPAHALLHGLEHAAQSTLAQRAHDGELAQHGARAKTIS